MTIECKSDSFTMNEIMKVTFIDHLVMQAIVKDNEGNEYNILDHEQLEDYLQSHLNEYLADESLCVNQNDRG